MEVLAADRALDVGDAPLSVTLERDRRSRARVGGGPKRRVHTIRIDSERVPAWVCLGDQALIDIEDEHAAVSGGELEPSRVVDVAASVIQAAVEAVAHAVVADDIERRGGALGRPRRETRASLPVEDHRARGR